MGNGWIVSNGSLARPGGPDSEAGGRTFIVSGLARGGTTLLAAALREAGLYLGTHLAELVGEDRQMLTILQSGNRALLERVIAERNAEHQDWGFKLPNLHAFLRYDEVKLFRNPHLILVFRDPVAVTIRNVVSEYFDQLRTLEGSVTAMQALVEFMRRANCPTLLVSYEKSLIKPAEFVDALAEFCGLTPNEATRARMVAAVEPSPEAYVRGARRQFAGAIDLVHDGALHGWCAQVGDLAPVTVDLLLDGVPTATTAADRFRPDLVNAGFGNGNHGFKFDLTPLATRPDTQVEVRISGRTFTLAKSGRPLATFAAPAPLAAEDEFAPAQA